MLQVLDDGTVVPVNLLEAPFLTYDSLGDLMLPPPSPILVAAAPNPSAPDYATRVQEFVLLSAPETFDGRETRFYSTYLGTVMFGDAFPDGNGDPNLLPGYDLEIWGVPTSLPGYRVIGPDQIDPSIVLQRWQRGVMLRDHAAEATTAAPLGWVVASILQGWDLPPGIAQPAASGPLWAQYDPNAENSVARPDELPNTNLTQAFEPE
jgi:hypothetical protein